MLDLLGVIEVVASNARGLCVSAIVDVFEEWFPEVKAEMLFGSPAPSELKAASSTVLLLIENGSVLRLNINQYIQYMDAFLKTLLSGPIERP